MENGYSMFDGFMPLIKNVTVSALTNSLASSGEIVDVHCINIQTVEGHDFVFSMSPHDLHRLNLLIMKTLMIDI
jgi:hypothetical protein